MRNNVKEFNKIGLIGENEFLPNFFDDFNSKEKMRQLFLNLVNCMIPDNCKFSKYEQKNFSKYNLNKVFKSKIENLKPVSFVKSFKTENTYSFNFCISSTIIINNYLDVKAKKVRKVLATNSNILPMANLLNFCFSNNNFELLIDKNYLFHEFILKKLKKIHCDKMIIDEGNSLSIIKDNQVQLKIYSSWKNINKNSLDVNEELKYVVTDIKNKRNDNIYLLYPKNKDFNKHIELKVEDLENIDYTIKLIPYSLRAILRQTI